MTIHEKIWHACKSIGKEEFNFEDIVMACFALYPDAFKMKNHDHPDTRKIAVHMSGNSGAVKRGVLMKSSDSTYRLGTIMTKETDRTYSNEGVKLKKWLHRFMSTSITGKMRGTIKSGINLIDVMQVLKIKQISGLGHTAMKEARENIRQIEMQNLAPQPDINFARSILDKITPLVIRYDRGFNPKRDAEEQVDT